MEERAEIPRNARELAQYLQEVLIRLEKDGKISQELGEHIQKAGNSSKNISTKETDIKTWNLDQQRAINQDS